MRLKACTTNQNQNQNEGGGGAGEEREEKAGSADEKEGENVEEIGKRKTKRPSTVEVRGPRAHEGLHLLKLGGHTE